MILVAGFYFHSSFYQIGLYSLLLVGGFVTFLVIGAARLIVAGELPRGRPRGELTFSLEAGDLLQRGVASVVVVPVEGPVHALVGQVVRGRFETGPEFGRYLVRDAARKFLSDVTDEDARAAGWRTAEDLRKGERGRRGWRPTDVVVLLRLERVGARS